MKNQQTLSISDIEKANSSSSEKLWMASNKGSHLKRELEITLFFMLYNLFRLKYGGCWVKSAIEKGHPKSCNLTQPTC